MSRLRSFQGLRATCARAGTPKIASQHPQICPFRLKQINISTPTVASSFRTIPIRRKNRSCFRSRSKYVGYLLNRNIRYQMTIPFTAVTIPSLLSMPEAWLHGLIGGSMIGMSSSLFLLFNGRIAGISGIFSRVFDHLWTFGKNKNVLASPSQVAFISGLFCGGWFINNNMQYFEKFGIETFKSIPFNKNIMLFAGILVGFGTRMGSGCTSGHGICGLARQSMRSLVAVSTFMASAVLTATMSDIYLPDLYKQLEMRKSKLELDKLLNNYSRHLSQYLVPILSLMLLAMAGKSLNQKESLLCMLTALISGFAFANGLAISGMTQPIKVRNFLCVNDWESWDPSLMFVMGGGLAITMIAFPFILKRTKPILFSTFNVPTLTKVDKKLVIGSLIFGIGWGLGGVCPGPGIVGLASSEHSVNMWIWLIGLLIGMRLYPMASARIIA